jgi:hypothetical protein
MDMVMDMDMDMETLADDTDAALAGDSGGEAERYEAAEAEAELLRDRLRLAVISIATAEGSICIASSRGFLRSAAGGPVASCSCGLESGKIPHLSMRYLRREEGWDDGRRPRCCLHRRFGIQERRFLPQNPTFPAFAFVTSNHLCTLSSLRFHCAVPLTVILNLLRI